VSHSAANYRYIAYLLVLFLLLSPLFVPSVYSQKQSSGESFCPQCGESNLRNARFCKNCGFNLPYPKSKTVVDLKEAEEPEIQIQSVLDDTVRLGDMTQEELKALIEIIVKELLEEEAVRKQELDLIDDMTRLELVTLVRRLHNQLRLKEDQIKAVTKKPDMNNADQFLRAMGGIAIGCLLLLLVVSLAAA